VVAGAGTGSFWHAVRAGGHRLVIAWSAAVGTAYAGQVTGFLNWWDSVELWLSGLGFVTQTLIVMPVALALAYGLAVLADGVLDRGIRMSRRVTRRDADEE
jgi:hypothetical protein